MHVLRRLAFWQEDVVQPRTGLDHLDDVAAAPGAAEAVDADCDAAPAPVELVDRRDRIPARLRLERWDHRILEIEEDGVGWPLRGLLPEARGGGGNGEDGTVRRRRAHEYLIFGLV